MRRIDAQMYDHCALAGRPVQHITGHVIVRIQRREQAPLDSGINERASGEESQGATVCISKRHDLFEQGRLGTDLCDGNLCTLHRASHLRHVWAKLRAAAMQMSDSSI